MNTPMHTVNSTGRWAKPAFLLLYLLFAVLPIYWMVNMSFKTNEEILSQFTLWPAQFTLANYATIFTDVSWYSGYLNSLLIVGINTVISLLVALPAAYAFSRYSFLGDKHLFFWLFVAVLSALQHGGFDGHPHRGGAGAPGVQRAAGGVDLGRLHVGHPA
jgi:ABC-type glycerol-3-phosphate transport system permease component